MKVLVTGGGGFLGSAICKQLLARGDEVIAYQRGAANELQALGAQVIRGDISDGRMLDSAARGTDAIIHTAAKAGLSLNYAEFHGVTLIGFARGNRMNIYTHPQRLGVENKS